MKKIRVIGDSILKGVVYDEENHKHKLLKDNGIKMLESAGFEIKNDAKFGLTIQKALQIVLADQNRDYDTMIIEIGGNDCNYNWDEVSENPAKYHTTNTPIDLFEEKLIELIVFLKNSGIHPILVSIPPLDDKLFYDYVSRQRKKENILKFLGETKTIYEHQKKYNDVIVRVSRLFDVTYVPLRETIERSKNLSEIYCKDGMHLNQLGQTILFQTLKAYIQ